MMRVLVVENLDKNPLTILHSGLIDDASLEIEETITSIVKGYNERAIKRAGGVLAWSLAQTNRRFEYRIDLVGNIRLSPPVKRCTITDSYISQSGKAYWYYCRASSFPNAQLEVYLYPHGKKFIHDGVLNSPDLLKKFVLSSDHLVNIDMSFELLKMLAKSTAEEEIEKWDMARRKLS